MQDQPLARRLQRLWWTPPPPSVAARALLGGPALAYGALVRLRHLAYRRGWLRGQHLGVPTLVIGNRIVGGAGKTPCTLALLADLQARGWRPGVVSRGYGRQDDAVRAVQPDSTAAEVGDEPLLIARRSGVPVWVGRDRHATGRALRRAHPEVDLVLCDDGLQHLALARDLEVVVFDERGTGNGQLLPLGPLREPLATPSLAAHHWVLQNADAETGAGADDSAPPGSGPAPPLAGLTPPWRARRALAGAVPLQAWWQGPPAQALVDWDTLRRHLAGQRLTAVAGIGAPERFFTALEAAGLTIDRRPCADHAAHHALPFHAEDTEVIVTEKDAVKLDADRLARERPGCRVWVAPLTLRLPTALMDEIHARLRAASASQACRTGPLHGRPGR